MKTAIIFLSIIVLFSCDKKREYLKNPCLGSQDKPTYSLSNDSVIVNTIDYLPGIYQKIQILGDKYLIGSTKNKYLLDIYDLGNKKYLKSIKIDKKSVPNLVSFYVHSLDSIFITQEPQKVSLINAEGNLINKWLLNNAPINWHLDTKENSVPLYFFEKDRENINFFDRKTGNLHLTLTNTDIYYFSNRQSFQLHHIFSIKLNKWVQSFGKIEEAYSDDAKLSKCYLSFQSHPFCTVVGDSSYVAYPMSHKVSIYNNKTGKLVNENCVSSQYIKSLLPPFDYDADHQTQRNFLITSPYYGSLSYHKGLDIFSRIALHEQSEKLPNGKLNNPLNKTVSVILFNKNLQKIDEFILDKESKFSSFGNPYSLFISYPTSDGFWGTVKDKYVSSKSSLRYSVKFKLTKK